MGVNGALDEDGGGGHGGGEGARDGTGALVGERSKGVGVFAEEAGGAGGGDEAAVKAELPWRWESAGFEEEFIEKGGGEGGREEVGEEGAGCVECDLGGGVEVQRLAFFGLLWGFGGVRRCGIRAGLGRFQERLDGRLRRRCAVERSAGFGDGAVVREERGHESLQGCFRVQGEKHCQFGVRINIIAIFRCRMRSLVVRWRRGRASAFGEHREVR